MVTTTNVFHTIEDGEEEERMVTTTDALETLFTTETKVSTPRITCAAACKYADIHREICLKDHITIGYGKANGFDWPCLDFEQREVTSQEFADLLLEVTRQHKQKCQCQVVDEPLGDVEHTAEEKTEAEVPEEENLVLLIAQLERDSKEGS